MAKIIYAYSRKIPFGQNDDRKLKLRTLCKRLEPDNLSRPPLHKTRVQGALAWGIVNDRNALIRGDSIVLGLLHGATEGWEHPRKEYPDGCYAMFRSGADCVEVVSDAAASRTIWYYADDEHFVASTSQRAIVMFLGSFRFNDRVIPWMLSTGLLGPDLSWDSRIKKLPPDSSVILDKKRWSVRVERRPIVFSPKNRSHSEHKELLANEIRGVMQSLKRSAQIDFRDYPLTLSGGYDSRSILCFLSEGAAPENLKAITWGLRKNNDRRSNDAAVARELAGRLGVPHKYFHTDVSSEPIEKVIDRFICCGEGRIDQIAAYVDGLEIWRKLLEEEGFSGVIRGDEGFGSRTPISSERTVRLNAGLGLCADYRNLDGIIERFGLPRQDLPAELQRRKDETLHGWRDRLYHMYRLATINAALSDIKCSYVEVINPLLARSILHRVREQPEPLRINRALFREVVDSVSPAVPYASEGANASPGDLLGNREVVELVRRSLRSEGAQRLFERGFLEYVLRCMRGENRPAMKVRKKTWLNVKSFFPRFMKVWVRDLAVKPILDGNVLAFRVFVILRMHELLSSDCAAAEVAANEVPPGTEVAAEEAAAT